MRQSLMRVAAIDVGTNTTRLLVAEGKGGEYRDIDRRLVFTRLGEGVDADKRLSAEAMKRTLGVITEFCAICGETQVTSLSVAGTSALRDASNSEGFVKAASAIAGVEMQVISGEEEARLTFNGATADLPFGLYLVCDIGGGSTEFILGKPRREVEGKISVDIGAVRLTERFLVSDPPATEEILTMEAAIDDSLTVADSAVPSASMAEFVGVAGTTTSLAAMFLGLESYDPAMTHLSKLTRPAVNSMYRDLAAMTVTRRLEIPSLPHGRADVIVAGASILARAMARWSFSQVIVSEKDILDGLVLDLIGDH